MDWTWFLFSFKGRINRAKCWLAGLVIICWMIFLSGLIAGIGKLLGGPASFGFNISDIFRIVDPASLGSLSQVSIVSIIVHGVGTPVFLWVYLATSIKRLHDRDKSGWWMVPFFVVPGLYGQFEHRLPNSTAVLPLALAAFVLTVWGFVELYVLSGDRSTNQFGPDPLLEARVRSRSPSRWDQYGEIEFGPRSAGPPPEWHVKRRHE
jgi:uncharacterized membrane protein YhaH (DUF805 family)